MTEDFDPTNGDKRPMTKAILPKGLSLRPATEEDLERVVAIEKAVHVAPWTEENFRAELEKPYSHFLVMTDDETDTEVAGYIVFWTLLDDCQILDVAVGLPHRGQGLGKWMVRQAAAEAVRKGYKKVTLEVRKSNLAAIQLYQGQGFVMTGIRKGFYSNGEDAYQMALLLEDNVIRF